ncbi:hypothetical protein GCM10010168_49530 [Actinoplanes ianthinogenes]|uniref:DUF4352 domain-containing protein n=1 Tax=Actinoplanes ianthinogenes TaxID=122358 RepID=A0ABN6CLT9_9ACTN|nr:DUF4352 domain-containing protein [Actinoplanes ianthinogenes]BCJ46005.1 hypothetical protein Aiant_66620 [Actinoplanes ianthinogenes]GGR25626.1 hypothetical protein GCM10010168_49530 [Actinoplanes ianthinogenes]
MSHDLRQQRRPVRAARRVSPLKVSIAVLVSVIAIIGLFAAGIAAQQYSQQRSAAPAAAQAAAAPPPGPGLGDAVRDGKLQFVVFRVDCAKRTLGVEHLKRTAAGRFCVVSLTVRNIGDSATYFVGHAQKAYDASGTEYTSDELAGIYANGGTEAFLQKVAPGAEVTGKLVFDVPKPVTLTTLKLHDSLLSDGAEVSLRQRASS